MSAEELLERAGMLDDDESVSSSTETAITADPDLTDEQKDALLAVYRSYRQSNRT
ncbi:MAG: hypothetical protein O3B23_09070 [Actinomycetota bacterium]|nr:hypothetical protein [Actinomycetota bacterium]